MVFKLMILNGIVKRVGIICLFIVLMIEMLGNLNKSDKS